MNNQHGVAAMALRIATEIAIKRIAGQAEDEAEIPMSDILLGDASTGTCVSGTWLEAAVQWNNFYVLFMTHNYLHDESEALSIYLLNDRFKLLDSASLFEPYPVIPYATGTFSDLALFEPNMIHFRFFDFSHFNSTMSVELLHFPGFRMPFFSEPHYVNRPFGFSRHFIVREIRHPETA